jgi:8-oxo-dGTP diphosphatase
MNWLKLLKAARCDTAATVLLRGDKVLMLQRGMSAPWCPGKWNLPGGVLNPLESPEQAALRECQEETGITPQGLTELFQINIQGCPVTFFVGHTSDDPQQGDNENENPNWLSIDEALALDCVPGVHRALRQARSSLHGYQGKDFPPSEPPQPFQFTPSLNTPASPYSASQARLVS